MPISTGKVRTLLARLALEPERPLSSSALAECIWDGDPPRSATGTLQGYVSRLRTALRKASDLAAHADGPTIEIVSRSGTYALHAASEQIDWQSYRRLSLRARALADTGDDQQALALLDRADALWRGEPLAGLPGLWAQRTRDHLVGRRLSASLTRAEVELRLGHYDELVPGLAELAGQHPWNEQIAAHLITALYGGGRINEAHAAYLRIQRRMHHDLGTEPGEQLNRLQAAVLRRDSVTSMINRPPSTPAAGAWSTTPAQTDPPTPGRRSSVLPREPELIGREAELNLLMAAARGEWPAFSAARDTALPVIALSGIPGSGKSTLALAAAHLLHGEFPDGALLVRIGAHSGSPYDPGPENTAAALLRQFGVPAAEVPLDADELLARCRELLSRRRALVLLDDAAGPGQIGPLLPASPTCFVLVTSRHRMAELPTVSTVPIDSLTPDAAAEMFTRLVGSDRADDPVLLADIVRRCAYHPLSLRIVAGRFRFRRSWTLAHLADRLSRNPRLDELQHGSDSLRTALAMSYHDLSGEHQIAFRRLSLHPGRDFGLLTAAVLIGCPVARAEHLIEELLAVNLLTEHSAERFGYHELVREYALAQEEHEEAPRQRADISRRVADFLLRMADRADLQVYPARFRMPVSAFPGNPVEETPLITQELLRRVPLRGWLAAETETLIDLGKDLRARGDHGPAAVLAHLFDGRLRSECLWRAAVEAHRAAAEHWREQGAERAELHARIALASSALEVSRYPEAESAIRRALALAGTTGDRRATAEALGKQAVLHWHRDDPQGALTLQREALALFHELGESGAAGSTGVNIGVLQSLLGDTAEALASLTEAVAAFRSCGDRRTALKITNNIGGIHLERGEEVAAREAFEHVLEKGPGILSPVDLAIAGVNLAELLEGPDETERAVHLLDSAMRTFRLSESRRHQAEAMNAKGLVLLRAARAAEAGEAYAAALAVARSIRSARAEASALQGLARVEESLRGTPGRLPDDQSGDPPPSGNPGAHSAGHV
ncbi:AfsR/SARP family transcriptional regulator [Kitasatospora phosalacinea]|uniref:AfsR/SARP family transcriptional regulator n=1 Tax=Kitasatospora phosalacinea TaxID=2065 RepID=UPI0005279ECE|nr:BTAD domain-containing putative transcriptional regulator [Kitasatospora phosalacinea]